MDPARRVYVAFELKTKAGHADMKNVNTFSEHVVEAKIFPQRWMITTI